MEVNMMVEELFIKADALVKEKKIQEAIEILQDILVIEPHFGKAYNHLAWIYETKYSMYDIAEENYKLAIELAPNYSPSYLNFAYLLSNLNRSKELKLHLDKASKVPSINMASINNEYAIMYECQGDFEKAIEYYKRYLKLLLSNDKVEEVVESIYRCRRKKEILNS